MSLDYSVSDVPGCSRPRARSLRAPQRREAVGLFDLFEQLEAGEIPVE